MFNLNDAIGDWRKRMTAAGMISPALLDELESHLREEMERQLLAGAAAQDAFAIAVQRIGRPNALKREFDKLRVGRNGWVSDLKRALMVAVCIFATMTAFGVFLGMHFPLWHRMVTAVVSAVVFLALYRSVGKRLANRLQLRPYGLEEIGSVSPVVRGVLEQGREEARRFHHDFIGTEHLLLGLMTLGPGASLNVPQRLGLDAESVRREVERFVGSGPDWSIKENIPCTPRARRAMNLAAREAQAANRAEVAAQDLFMGLLLEGDGVAARVLNKLGVDVEKTRRELRNDTNPG
jgi:hypothetical protein